MKILGNILTCFICIALLSACSKSDVWVERALTQCGEYDSIALELTRDDELAAIKLMMEDSLDIDILEIKEVFRSSLEESCRACSCRTGYVISLKVNEAHVTALSVFGYN